MSEKKSYKNRQIIKAKRAKARKLKERNRALFNSSAQKISVVVKAEAGLNILSSNVKPKEDKLTLSKVPHQKAEIKTIMSKKEAMVHAQALKILQESLGDSGAGFHEHQWESIDTLVNQRSRLLVVQKTGWGKSSVYFIATHLLRDQGYGPSIIISPLLALMRNQIDSAAKYGVRLGSINSANSREDNKETERALLADELDAIIISPEKLGNDGFVQDILAPIAANVGLFVIDEAHCISDWGHDFRTDYKRITQILNFMPPNMPVLATTATANQRVMDDIVHQLGDDITVFRGQLTRESLSLQNIVLPRRSHRLAWLADTLLAIDGTGIVYAATVRDAIQVAEWLQQCDIDAHAYTGQLDPGRRLELEGALLKNKIKALVATSALGMGYDKPDLAFVIHYQSPGSVVSYYQQVGRAGRGIDQARGVLLSGKEDDDIQQFFMSSAFPEEELVQTILEQLAESDQGLKLAELHANINERPKKIEAAIKYLSTEHPAPIIKVDASYQRTVVDYTLPHEAIARLSLRKQDEWQQMQEYMSEKSCLMQFLANALDDDLALPCGRCANCAPENTLSINVDQERGQLAAEFLENVLIEIEPKKRAANGAVQAASRFPEYKFNFNFGELAHEPGRVLCRWGEAGWGELAKNGKRDHKFDPRLAKACVRMISDRWKPDPMPTWVAYVPSQNHPELVSEFASLLAGQLGLPLVEAVVKNRVTEPQKMMENTDFRCKNIDGAFSVQNIREGEPVLLIDDAVDSGWTFAIIAALLKREGSGPVFPLAVMSTTSN
jgi:ATP-dependent DNA helicase RecQ